MRRRIVSLVPSLTQTVAHLGLADEIIGCTQFCIDPPGLHRRATLVGGTKNPTMEIIQGLKPTHILVNSEENTPQHIAACRNLAPVLETYPRSFGDVVAMLNHLGDFLGCQTQANALSRHLSHELDDLTQICLKSNHLKCHYLYFIWRNPYMVASHDTYISNALNFIGWVNRAPYASQKESRYPILDSDTLQNCRADLLLFSTEPYPFRKRDALRMRQEWPFAPGIMKIDGRLMSWYGALSLRLVSQLKNLVLGSNELLIPLL